MSVVFGIPTLRLKFLPSDDFCTEGGQVLLTDHKSGTYQLFHLGSRNPLCRFFPRTPLSQTSQPVSHAKFLSRDVIVGGGVGQLVLWSIDTEARLQNLTYRNQSKLRFLSSLVFATQSHKRGFDRGNHLRKVPNSFAVPLLILYSQPIERKKIRVGL